MPRKPTGNPPGRPPELEDPERTHIMTDRPTRDRLDRIVKEQGFTPERQGNGWSAAVRWLAEEWDRRARRRRKR